MRKLKTEQGSQLASLLLVLRLSCLRGSHFLVETCSAHTATLSNTGVSPTRVCQETWPQHKVATHLKIGLVDRMTKRNKYACFLFSNSRKIRHVRHEAAGYFYIWGRQQCDDNTRACKVGHDEGQHNSHWHFQEPNFVTGKTRHRLGKSRELGHMSGTTNGWQENRNNRKTRGRTPKHQSLNFHSICTTRSREANHQKWPMSHS